MGWLGSFLIIVGRLLLGQGMWTGFAVSALGDLCWIHFGVKRKIYSLVFLDVILLAADLVGVIEQGT